MLKGQICVSVWRDGTETQQATILQIGPSTYMKGTTQMNKEAYDLFGGSQKSEAQTWHFRDFLFLTVAT